MSVFSKSNFSKKTAFKDMLANKPFQNKNSKIFNYSLITPFNNSAAIGRRSEIIGGSMKNLFARS
jgi:hypothetical protein